MRNGCLARKGLHKWHWCQFRESGCQRTLVVPNTELVISNTHKEEKLLLLSVYLFLPAVEKRSGICCAGLSCVDYVVEGSGVIDHSTAHVFGKSYHRRAGGSVPNTSKTIASFQGVRCRSFKYGWFRYRRGLLTVGTC